MFVDADAPTQDAFVPNLDREVRLEDQIIREALGEPAQQEGGIRAPTLGLEPLDEFAAAYWSNAYPHLFPTGKANLGSFRQQPTSRDGLVTSSSTRTVASIGIRRSSSPL